MPYAKRASTAKSLNRAMTFQRLAEETNHAISHITKIIHAGRLPRRRPIVDALAKSLGLDAQASWDEISLDRLENEGRVLIASLIEYKRAVAEVAADTTLYCISMEHPRVKNTSGKYPIYTPDEIGQIFDMKMVQAIGSEKMDRIQKLMGFFEVPGEDDEEILNDWESGEDSPVKTKGARRGRASIDR